MAVETPQNLGSAGFLFGGDYQSDYQSDYQNDRRFNSPNSIRNPDRPPSVPERKDTPGWGSDVREVG